MGGFLPDMLGLGLLIVAMGFQDPSEVPPGPGGAVTTTISEQQLAAMVDRAVARAIDRISPPGGGGGTPYPPTPSPSPTPAPWPAPQSYGSPQSAGPVTLWAAHPASYGAAGRVKVQLPRGPVARSLDAVAELFKRAAAPRIREYPLAPMPAGEYSPFPPAWASPQR